MAYCPKCDGGMARDETVCSHCGYEFPPIPAAKTASIFYSPLAKASLLIGMIFAAVLCAIYAVAFFMFFPMFAMFVLFGRALNDEGPKEP
jgi:hypothetical protein